MRDERQVLNERTRCFELRIIKMYCSLLKTTEAQVLGKQALLISETGELLAILTACSRNVKKRKRVEG